MIASRRHLLQNSRATSASGFEKNHATAQELWVGFHKKGSGNPSITWPESVDEALCFGWIDGIRKNLDETSYTIRFTPRKHGSIWSAVNIKRAEELIELGRMKPAGLEAFEKRREDRSRRYSYEQQGTKLVGEYEEKLKANSKAWKFLKHSRPGIRKISRLVGHEREEGRNPAPSPRTTHRRLRSAESASIR